MEDDFGDPGAEFLQQFFRPDHPIAFGLRFALENALSVSRRDWTREASGRVFPG